MYIRIDRLKVAYHRKNIDKNLKKYKGAQNSLNLRLLAEINLKNQKGH